MRKINERYVIEEYDEQGVLTKFDLDIPDDFNFAYDCVDDIALAEPDRPAMVWCNPEGEEHFFTFGDMKYWSDKVARMLFDHGVRRGDMVMVILRRHYQFWFTAVALHKIGAVMVPATFMLKEHDLEYRLNSAEVKYIICTSQGFIPDVVDATVPRCPSVRELFLVNGGGGGTGDPDDPTLGAVLSGPDHVCELTAEREGWVDFNAAVRETPAEFERVETLASDPLLMYFSSGTSGNPKMVLHSGPYALAHIVTAKHWHNVVSDGGIHFTIADTGWGKAVWGKFYGQWLMEACVLTYDFDRFDPAAILGLIEKYKVTSICAPTTMYRMMMLEDVDSFDLSSLVYSTTAGEALNPDLFEAWKEHTGLTLFEGFGQTETPLTVANLTNMVPRPGSMGKPSPLYHVEIHDADERKCPPGQTGEICIRLGEDGKTTPPGIMMEYYRNEERTSEALRNGWYHTGDTAWLDEDGFMWYVGRNDDVIKSSGYRIGPFEIESVLLEHDAVKECAVTGVPDPLRGAAVKATIVLMEGFVASDELTAVLQKWCKDQTAPYKYPRIVDYVEELPRTINGKIRRNVIRERDLEASK